MKEIKVKITFIDDVLGTSAADENIYRNFIASKSPDPEAVEEEVKALTIDEKVENAMTIFPKMADGTPFLWDYQIRGFFKEVCGIMKQIPGTESSKIKANKKLIDNYIFVTPREIPIDMHGGMIDICQRPLRASTAMGERVTLVISEMIPEGSSIEFSVLMTTEGKTGKKAEEKTDYTTALSEWLDYGKLKGIGQWRNSGKGRFTYEIIE